MNKLSNVLSEILASTLQQNDIDSVMEAWNERKNDVSKLFETGNRTKRKKDPNAPKKWKTGYILFCVDQREKLKKENNELSATEITSRLGALWKKLSDKDKAKYELLSKKDKARYEKDMESYTPPAEEQDEKGKRGRGKKERTGPKRPLSAYMYYCQDTRDSVKNENSNMGGKEITTELGRRWKALTDEQKAPFEAKASSDKARFESEKAVSSTDNSKTPKESSSSKKAPKETPKKTDANVKKSKATTKPVKEEPLPKGKKEVPSSKKSPGFEHFCDEQRDDIQSENPDWGARKVTAELQKRWQDLTSDDREAYETEAADDLDDENESEVELEEN